MPSDREAHHVGPPKYSSLAPEGKGRPVKKLLASELADRLDAALADELISVRQFIGLADRLLPEEYASKPPGPATNHGPGTFRKISDLAHRAAHGLPLQSPGDAAAPDDAPPPGFVLVVRLKAVTMAAAVREARGLVGSQVKPNRQDTAQGLPNGASIERG